MPLPDGWRIEGLWTDGERTVTTNPTDAEVRAADAIIVSYTDDLGKDYRTIHGAPLGIDQVGDLIEAVTERDSPVR